MDLIGLEDGPHEGAYFEFIWGDGCEVGLNDWETKLPMQGAPMTIKEVLAQLCRSPEEERQPIQGSNKYGKRSEQKASWTQETRDRILLALEKEAAHRTSLVAFAGEIAIERATAEGPIDAEIDKRDDEYIQTRTGLPPTATLPSSEEKEQ